MKNDLNDPTSQRTKDYRQSDDQLASIDLALLMEQIKAEKSWKDGKWNAIPVFRTHKLRILLIALDEDSEMERHTAGGMISVQVLEGRMQFKTDRQHVELAKGQMLVLREEDFRIAKAIGQVIFLLTVIPSFPANRNHL